MSDPGLPSTLTLVGEPSGCTLWRTWQPIAMLQQKGYPAEWEHNEQRLVAAVAPAFDAYVLARLSWKGQDYQMGARWVEAMHRAGKVVLYEADDDLFSPWIIPQQKAGVQKGATIAQLEDERMARVRALQLCDGVTVSTPRLATVVRQYVAEDVPVEVVPNYLDYRWFRAVQRAGGPTPHYGPPGSVVIGWVGGTRPDSDVLVMLQAWGIIAQRYAQAHFVVAGYQFDTVAEHVPPQRLTRLPWLPLESYPLAYRGIDVGCCPLVDRPFNRCKTPIKAYEFAASGAAVVASPTVYRAAISDGVDGALVTTLDEWVHALSRLVEDAALRRTWARALRRKVAREYGLEANAWRWGAAWQSIVDSYRARRVRWLLAS